MRQHKLRLEDLAVESFDTVPGGGFAGTVKAHDESEEGTFLSVCRSCPNTCDEYTCQNTCEGKYTCQETCGDKHTCKTCWPVASCYTCEGQYTCYPGCDGGDTSAC